MEEALVSLRPMLLPYVIDQGAVETIDVLGPIVQVLTPVDGDAPCGYWNVSPEENAAIGLDVAAPGT